MKEDHLRNIPMKFCKNQVQINSPEKFFEGKVYDELTEGRTEGRTDGHNAMTIARWPLASGAKH